MKPQSTDPPRGDLATLATLFPYLWQYKGRVLLAMAFLLVAKLANVGVPWVLKDIVDALDPAQNALILLPVGLLLAYGGLRLANTVFSELRDLVFARVTQRAIRRIALQVFEHLHRLSLAFHLERRTGGVSRDIERGCRGIGFVLNFMLFNILPTIAEIALVAVILLARYDWPFAAVTLGTIGAYIAFTLGITEWRMRFHRRMNELDSRANARAIDSLLNYETVKYFNNEAYEARRYDAQLAQWEQAALANQRSLSVLNLGQGTIIAVGITALMFLAAEEVVAGTMTLGELVMVNAYLLQLYMPLGFLGFVYREIRHSLSDMERMFALLRENQTIPDSPDARPLQITHGEVAFRDVHFGYHPQRPILKGVSFTIGPGEKVAVVGPSGAGKSTLARLLFRFYDVDAGAIEIDGQDIRRLTQESLRAAIGVVPQDTVLFNDTLYYNIAYGRPEASREEVIAAARAAHIHDFIQSLPEGYDTLVGERGLKLSGGEKQRIAIARALLKDPPIMVFDEATSALDSHTEEAILETLREAARSRTTLVIAHRLSTVVDADRILVLRKGRIVEAGCHHELLERGGVYAEMWRLQQQGR